MSWLARRNPTVKLATLFVASFIVILLVEPRPILVLLALALVAVRIAARVPWRTLALGLVPFLIFAAGVLTVNAVSRPGAELWPGFPLRVTIEGLTVGAALALRAMVIGVLTIGFLRSTEPRDLMVSLEQHAHLSPRYAYAILAGHRMLATMPARWQTIRAAHSVRAPLDRRGRPRFGLREAGRCAFALLVDAIRASERISLALEARGLSGNRHRTQRIPIPLGWPDALLAAGVIAAVLGAWWATR